MRQSPGPCPTFQMSSRVVGLSNLDAVIYGLYSSHVTFDTLGHTIFKLDFM